MRLAPAVRYVEIPVADLARAIAFYGYVFDVAIETVEIDGNEMALLPDPGESGARLALARGESYRPSLDGTRVYVDVADIEQTLARAIDRGGSVLYPKTSIGELGYVAEFQDSEGNRIALSSDA